jgi:serine/threonine protein kinase
LGQNLEQVVKAATHQGSPLPMGFIGRVIRDACLGLHYAHHFTDPLSRPMVVAHRDVSPKNVMLKVAGPVPTRLGDRDAQRLRAEVEGPGDVLHWRTRGPPGPWVFKWVRSASAQA